MSRRKNQGHHAADTTGWSATKQARQLVELRDLTITQGRDNPLIIRMDVDDLTTALYAFIASARKRGSTRPVAEAIEWAGHPELRATGPTEDGIRNACIAERQRTTAHLETAEPYIISPDMHATTIAAAYTLTDTDPFRIHYDDLPSESGLLMFPMHMIVEPPEGGVPQDLIAVSWAIEPHTVSGRPVRMLAIRSWLDTNGPVEVDAFTTIKAAAKEAGVPLPPWTKLARTAHPLVDDIVADELLIGDEFWELSRISGSRRTDLTADSDEVTAEYDTSDAIPNQDVHNWVRKYLFALFRLADQKIAETSPFRAGINPAMKHQPHHDTTVVQLRAPKRATSHDGGETTRHYTQRFVVRMHRTNQWYPSQNRHKVIWRGPYIKGPEGAPMKKGTRVNALTR